MSSISLAAQFGISAKYLANDVPDWDQVVEDKFAVSQELFSTGYEIGVDYWFRLKSYRIEFFPEVAYSLSSSSSNNNFINEYKWRSWHFNLNTHIYFMDLLGDCDCPTFSKEGSGAAKGVFLLLSPGLGLTNNSMLLSEDGSSLSSKSTYFKIGGGLGLDVGVSDLLTVTPFFMLNYAPSVNWENFESDQDLNDWLSGDHKSNLTQLQIGIRLGFRPDYLRSQNRLRRR